MALIKDFFQDKLRVKVFDTRAAMGVAGGSDAAAAMKRLLSEKDEINVIFAAAPSQNEVLETLCADTGIDWSRVNAFHMDEYIGLPEDAPQGFFNFLNERLFARKPFKTVNRILGNAPDIEAECARYSALLQDNPVDIVVLGIGENGHIAFNDPWVADFDDPALVKAVPLDEVCRMQQVNDGCFAALSEVPTHALTLTIPALFAGRELFCGVPASTKAEAVRRTVFESVSEKCPATVMRRHSCATLYCDGDSGRYIRRILNVAIIGQGRSGRDIHAAFLSKERGRAMFRVVAVVDKLALRRERAAEQFGCDVYEDYRELFARKDIDLVINSSYSYLHYPVTLDLLKHGFNVVTEKPFAAHAADCTDMISAAEKHGVMLSVFQQSHFAPYFKRIKEILASGKLGRPVQVDLHFSGFGRRWDWQCIQEWAGGSLLNTGPHPLEQILDLLDSDEMPQIYSRLETVLTSGDAEDYCKALITLPGKPLFDLEISSCDAYNDYTYKIQCSRGSLKATTSHIDWKYFVPEDEPERPLTTEPIHTDDGYPAYCGEKLTWHEFSEDPNGSAFTSAVCEYYDNIYDHLVSGAPLVIRPEKIRQLIAVAEEIHRQNPLPVKYPKPDTL